MADAESKWPPYEDMTVLRSIQLLHCAWSDYANRWYNYEMANAIEFAIKECAEYRWAKEPLRIVYPHESYLNHFICPTCRADLPFDKKYCVECGQAIDWTDSQLKEFSKLETED